MDLAKTNFHEVGDSEISRNVKPSEGVITRGMLKDWSVKSVARTPASIIIIV